MGWIARKESVRENNAVSKTVYQMAGFKQIRWKDYDHCPYCASLNDKTINIENELFLRSGDEYKPDGVDQPFTVNHDIGHPPLCDSCECLIVASK